MMDDDDDDDGVHKLSCMCCTMCTKPARKVSLFYCNSVAGRLHVREAGK